MARPKTAVILIHGMGEQRPMDTLWGFVEMAWKGDRKLVHPTRNDVWSKPELVSGSFELRRVTTREASAGCKSRFDFFEFYWAHHMRGHTLGGLGKWMLRLFVRPPSAVPPGMFMVWTFGILLLLAALVFAAISTFTNLANDLGVKPWLVAAAPIFLTVAAFITNAIILPYAGDAARYLSASPDNVAIRQQIREDGVSLLEKLTASGEYDRIVLAGHSLGSVIAYDILNFAWNRIDDAEMARVHAAGSAASNALTALEEAARTLVDASSDRGAARMAFRDAQRDYSAALAADENPVWLVSELVTIGSPLSKADILIGRDEADLAARVGRRELPSSPPVLEGSDLARAFSFSVEDATRIPHHGAALASVVWTNVYMPNRLILFGDLISGTVSNLFGSGVLDVRVPIGWPPGFRHLDYWKLGVGKETPAAARALQRALNLRLRKRESDIWGGAATAAEIDAASLTEEF